jgi:glycosyltransferase involved in cell wall biosynthesis
MAGTPSITIIIPAYNEEKRIGSCLQRLRSFCNSKNWDFEIIVVLDDSTDNTANIVNSYHSLDGRISLLTVTTRLGKGGSIAVGAAQYNTKDYTAYLDADLSADPSQLDMMIPYMENYDIVIGSRILRGNLPGIERPFHRTLLSHLFSKTFRILFRMPIYDPQCGIKLFRSCILPSLFRNTTISGFAFDIDLIVTAYSMSMKVKEIPVNWTHGKSSTVNVLSEIRSMGLDLLSVWYYYHLKWQRDEICYPQKKGSILGRCLFHLLNQIQEIRNRPQKYLNYHSLLTEIESIQVESNSTT